MPYLGRRLPCTSLWQGAQHVRQGGWTPSRRESPISLEICDRLHVTVREGYVHNQIDHFERQGSCASRAFAAPRSAPGPDLGAGRQVHCLCARSPQAISHRRVCPVRAGRPALRRRHIGVAFRVKRGHIWTVAGGPDYAGKPRPAIILQDDAFDATSSITVCPLTTERLDAPLIRLPIEPSERNGLKTASHVMVDKITTVSKRKLDEPVGRLSRRGHGAGQSRRRGLPWARGSGGQGHVGLKGHGGARS